MENKTNLYNVIDPSLDYRSSKSEIKQFYLKTFNSLLLKLERAQTRTEEKAIEKSIVVLEDVWKILSNDLKREKYDSFLTKDLKNNKRKFFEEDNFKKFLLSLCNFSDDLYKLNKDLNKKDGKEDYYENNGLSKFKIEIDNLYKNFMEILRQQNVRKIPYQKGSEFNEEIHDVAKTKILNNESGIFEYDRVDELEENGFSFFGDTLKKQAVKITRPLNVISNFKDSYLTLKRAEMMDVAGGEYSGFKDMHINSRSFLLDEEFDWNYDFLDNEQLDVAINNLNAEIDELNRKSEQRLPGGLESFSIKLDEKEYSETNNELFDKINNTYDEQVDSLTLETSLLRDKLHSLEKQAFSIEDDLIKNQVIEKGGLDLDDIKNIKEERQHKKELILSLTEEQRIEASLSDDTSDDTNDVAPSTNNRDVTKEINLIKEAEKITAELEKEDNGSIDIDAPFSINEDITESSSIEKDINTSNTIENTALPTQEIQQPIFDVENDTTPLTSNHNSNGEISLTEENKILTAELKKEDNGSIDIGAPFSIGEDITESSSNTSNTIENTSLPTQEIQQPIFDVENDTTPLTSNHNSNGEISLTEENKILTVELKKEDNGSIDIGAPFSIEEDTVKSPSSEKDITNDVIENTISPTQETQIPEPQIIENPIPFNQNQPNNISQPLLSLENPIISQTQETKIEEDQTPPPAKETKKSLLLRKKRKEKLALVKEAKQKTMEHPSPLPIQETQNQSLSEEVVTFGAQRIQSQPIQQPIVEQQISPLPIQQPPQPLTGQPINPPIQPVQQPTAPTLPEKEKTKEITINGFIQYKNQPVLENKGVAPQGETPKGPSHIDDERPVAIKGKKGRYSNFLATEATFAKKTAKKNRYKNLLTTPSSFGSGTETNVQPQQPPQQPQSIQPNTNGNTTP